MDVNQKIDRIADLFESIIDHSETQGIEPVDLPEPDRSVYFIYDIYGVTINGRLESWIYYHGQDEDKNEVVVAIDVFKNLGLSSQAEALFELLEIYRKNGGAFPEGFSGGEYSKFIWDCEEQIFDALIKHVDASPKPGD